LVQLVRRLLLQHRLLLLLLLLTLLHSFLCCGLRRHAADALFAAAAPAGACGSRHGRCQRLCQLCQLHGAPPRLLLLRRQWTCMGAAGLRSMLRLRLRKCTLRGRCGRLVWRPLRPRGCLAHGALRLRRSRHASCCRMGLARRGVLRRIRSRGRCGRLHAPPQCAVDGLQVP
jgi:hypothetical protein